MINVRPKATGPHRTLSDVGQAWVRQRNGRDSGDLVPSPSVLIYWLL